MKGFWSIVAAIFVVCFASRAYADPPSSIGYIILNHRLVENQESFNRLAFDLLDLLGNEAEYSLSAARLYAPDGTEISLNGVTYGSTGYLPGNYNGNTGIWSYDSDFTSDKSYWADFLGTLVAGTYRLEVDVEGVTLTLTKDYSGVNEQPIISSSSFQKYIDGDGNLFLRWKPPHYAETGLSISVRAYVEAYNNDIASDYAYVTIPAHMGNLWVPNHILALLNTKGNNLRFYVHVRTNDNANRSYSEQVAIDQIPGYSDCDVNSDGKTGLEEAVHALRIAAGVTP